MTRQELEAVDDGFELVRSSSCCGSTAQASAGCATVDRHQKQQQQQELMQGSCQQQQQQLLQQQPGSLTQQQQQQPLSSAKQQRQRQQPVSSDTGGDTSSSGSSSGSGLYDLEGCCSDAGSEKSDASSSGLGAFLEVREPGMTEVLYVREGVAVWPSNTRRILGRVSLVKQHGIVFLSWLPYGSSSNGNSSGGGNSNGGGGKSGGSGSNGNSSSMQPVAVASNEAAAAAAAAEEGWQEAVAAAAADTADVAEEGWQDAAAEPAAEAAEPSPPAVAAAPAPAAGSSPGPAADNGDSAGSKQSIGTAAQTAGTAATGAAAAGSDRAMYAIHPIPLSDVRALVTHTSHLSSSHTLAVVLVSGLTLPPLYFAPGGVKQLLSVLRQHVRLAKAAEEAGTYLIDDAADPLQRSLVCLDLTDILLGAPPPGASCVAAPDQGPLSNGAWVAMEGGQQQQQRQQRRRRQHTADAAGSNGGIGGSNDGSSSGLGMSSLWGGALAHALTHKGFGSLGNLTAAAAAVDQQSSSSEGLVEQLPSNAAAAVAAAAAAAAAPWKGLSAAFRSSQLGARLRGAGAAAVEGASVLLTAAVDGWAAEVLRHFDQEVLLLEDQQAQQQQQQQQQQQAHSSEPHAAAAAAAAAASGAEDAVEADADLVLVSSLPAAAADAGAAARAAADTPMSLQGQQQEQQESLAQAYATVADAAAGNAAAVAAAAADAAAAAPGLEGQQQAADSLIADTRVGAFELLEGAPADAVGDMLAAATSRPQLPPLALQELQQQFCDAEGVLRDAAGFRQRVFAAGVAPDARREVWKFLLGVYPADSSASDRAVLRQQQEDGYAALKQRWHDSSSSARQRRRSQRLRDQQQQEQELQQQQQQQQQQQEQQELQQQQQQQQPPSHQQQQLSLQQQQQQQDVADDNNSVSCWRERRGHIDRDVLRTDRQHSFFRGKDAPAHLASLRDVLRAYCCYNPPLGYCQGMSDLASPLLVVNEGDEVDTFWCFVALMERLQGNFATDQQGMHKQLAALRQLVQVLDPQLHSFLEERDCLHYFFAFRWLLIHWKREFSFDQVLSLWEACWSCPLTRHLHLYLAAAVLIQHRRLLLADEALDFDGLLAFAVERAGKLDLRALLQLAEALVVVSGPAGEHCCEGLP